MNTSSDRLINALTYSWAGFLLSIAGIIIALMKMSSHRKAATFVLIGMILLLLNTLRYPLIDLVFADEWRQRSGTEYIRLLRIQGTIGQVLHLGSGLFLLWGAFTGRSVQHGAGFPLYPPQPPTYPPQQGFRPPPPM